MSDFEHLDANAQSIWDDLRWPSWLEIGVIVATLAILWALLLPADSNAEIEASVAEKLAAYQDGAVSTATIDPSILDRGANLAGGWRRFVGHTGPYLEFEKDFFGGYRVSFATGSRSGRCSLQRRATFDDAMVLLDEPVAEWTGPAFRRLFAVKVDGWRYLVPEPDIANFLQALSANREKVVEFNEARFHAYKPIDER